MGHDGKPREHEGAVSVLPAVTEEIDDSTIGRNFFGKKPEVETLDAMAAFDAAVALKGLADHSLEHKELMWQRDLLAQLGVGSRVSIYDGSGPLYGTLSEEPVPTEDPLRCQLTIIDSQTGQEVVRVAALGSIIITET